MIIFAKWSTPLHFAKMVIFACILPSFCCSTFQTQLWCLCATIMMPTHPTMMPPLPPLTLYHQCNSITTHHHHSHAHYQACMSHKWLQMTATWAQMMATCHLGSRVYFFWFISSFYKLTNCNLSFLGSILPVMTGTNAAQPMPTPTCTANPSSLSKWDVMGLG